MKTPGKKKMKFSAPLFLLGLTLSASNAFQPAAPTKVSTALWGKIKRKGILKDLAEEGYSGPKQNKKKSTTGSAKSKKNKKGTVGGVSSDLASWAASQDTPSKPAAAVDVVEDEVETLDDLTADFVSFAKEPKSKRRMKQTERMQLDKKNDAISKSMVSKLEDTLESNNNIDDILDVIMNIVNLESTNLRVMTNGAQKINYRLAWVGSDDALCHIGTGLHKVPLARMQEVFLNLQGKGRVEIYEVISLIGPFPNVRNTLYGDTKVAIGDPVTEWTIVMDSMVDGTGNEILAGKEENVRRVPVQVYFSDQNAIVAIVPPEEGGLRENPFEDNGKNVLVFVREDDIDEKLEALRVL